MCTKAIVIILFPLLYFSPYSLFAGNIYIGDTQSWVVNPESDSRFDSGYPDMARWAHAGVTGGIPEIDTSVTINRRINERVISENGGNFGRYLRSVIRELKDSIGTKESKEGIKAVIFIENGHYTLQDSILRNILIDSCTNLAIIGENSDSTVITVNFLFTTKDTATYGSHAIKYAFEIRNCRYFGIQSLTFIHGKAREKILSRSFKHSFKKNDSQFKVGFITFRRSSQCWLSDCNLLYAADNPVNINRSSYCTMRRNLIDFSYNSGDGGHGYYGIFFSEGILVADETVRNIRHFSIQNNGSQYNVVVNCVIGVDVNFHNGDSGHNLVEKNVIIIPQNRFWRPLERGDEHKHQLPGCDNLLYNNFDSTANMLTLQKNYNGYNQLQCFTTDTVYRVNCEKWGGKTSIEPLLNDKGVAKKPPKAECLYLTNAGLKPVKELLKY